MKKFYSLFMILLMIISITMTGCSKKEESSKGKSSSNQKTIKFATFYSGNEQGAIYKELAKDFEEKNNDIKVDVVTDYGDEEKVKEGLSQKGEFDIIGIKRNNLIEFAKSGLLSDMSDTIDESGLRNKLYKISLAYGYYNGKNYGIGDLPMSMEWFYNSSLFERNKLKEPSNLKELINICKKMKAKKIIPIDVGAIDGFTVCQLFGMITSQTTGINDLTTYYGTDMNSYEKINNMNLAFNIMGKLTGTCILKNSSEINYMQSVEDFVNGKSAMLPAGSWAVQLIDKIKPTGFKYSVFKNPVSFISNPNSLYSVTAGEVLVIPSNSKNNKEASKFIDYIFSEEAQKKFTDKSYNSSLIAANITTNDMQKQIYNHIEAADNNSIMLMDNLEPTMLGNLTLVLKDIIQGNIKTNIAWNRVLKLTFEH